MTSILACRPACWTPRPCPSCGSPLPPRGRSVPLAVSLAPCCDEARMDPAANPRHLWSEDEAGRDAVPEAPSGRITLMSIGRQRVIWNGEILTVPFTDGVTTAAATKTEAELELGLFTPGMVQMDPGDVLPGCPVELILRPVYLH